MGKTERILTILRQSGDFVSGTLLCEELGVSRTAVWKHVNKLRERGYCITSVRHRGHRLDSSPDLLVPEEVIPRLQTDRFGRDYRFLEETVSTNAVASRLANEGCPEGAVVVADAQSGGRGRLSRGWFSPPSSNLHVSVVLRPEVAPGQAPQMALVTAVVLRRAIQTSAPCPDISIKWPNDVLIAGRKVGGILCEMGADMDRVKHLVVGVGVNVNTSLEDFPPEIGDQATSLCTAVGHEVRRSRLLGTFLNDLESAYDVWRSDGLAPFLPELRDYSTLLGRHVALTQLSETLEGIAEDLSPDGALLLRLTDGQLREVLCGDVHILDY
mgnify:CR=1 FL=1